MTEAISYLAFLGLIVVILFYRYKSKERRLETVLRIVELGGNADPEMMALLGARENSYKLDIRKGLIWLAIGIPLTISLLLEEGIGSAVVGTIPVLIGIALLISAKYRLREI